MPDRTSKDPEQRRQRRKTKNSSEAQMVEKRITGKEKNEVRKKEAIRALCEGGTIN